VPASRSLFAPRTGSGAARVLLVDSKPSIRRGWARALFDAGIDALTAEDIEAAPGLLHGAAPVVLVASAAMLTQPGHGDRTAELLARSTIIALADPTDAGSAVLALRGRVFALLDRVDTPPPGLGILVDSARAVAGHAGAETAPPSTAQAADLVAASSSMRKLVARASSLADAAQPVLVLGPEGAGKRTLARVCHTRGRRSPRPFAVLDMLALDGDEVASAMFDASRAAGSGTLVLHRVDALDREGQAVLLEILTEARPPARIVATALPSLREAERSGVFRSELYYRLAGQILDLPELSARRDDIPVLAYTIARRVTEELGLLPKRFSAEVLRVLRNAPWPGNVPELEERVRAAVVSSARDVLTLGDFGFDRAPARRMAVPDMPYVAARDSVVSEFERAYVDAVVERAQGNLSRAAHLAGMDRANFRRLFRRVRGKTSP